METTEPSVSDETGSSREKSDPTYVPVRRSTVLMERIADPTHGRRRDTSDDTSLSEDSIKAINETIKKRKNPERKPVNKNKIISTDSDKEATITMENIETDKCYKAMSAPELGACAHEALRKAEEVNVKSKNIKGGLKGQLRDSISDLKEIIHALIIKINARGDIEFLRADTAKEVAKNIALTTEMEKLKRENEVLKVRLNEMEAKIDM